MLLRDAPASRESTGAVRARFDQDERRLSVGEAPVGYAIAVLVVGDCANGAVFVRFPPIDPAVVVGVDIGADNRRLRRLRVSRPVILAPIDAALTAGGRKVDALYLAVGPGKRPRIDVAVVFP